MRNLPPPCNDNIKTYNNILSDKSGLYAKRLKRVRAGIKKRYAEYDTNRFFLENIALSTIKGVKRKALVHAYSSSTKSMSVLRSSLLHPDIEDFDECPFCGIGEPNTLDHYLPKEDYPEFSVFGKNLIPICGTCNSNYKGTKCFDGGNRIFIHTYFDIFPAFDYLKMTISVTTKSLVDFNIVSDPTNQYFSDLFTRHFNELHLNKRYKRKVCAEISRKRNTFQRIYRQANSPVDVSDQLAATAKELRNSYAGNHWKVAMYEALANSMDFCDQGFMKSAR